MPDFVPDDMEAYVSRAQRVDRVMNVADNAEIEGCMEKVAEWAVNAAEALVLNGLEPIEAVSGVTGMLVGVMTEWYHVHAEDDDG